MAPRPGRKGKTLADLVNSSQGFAAREISPERAAAAGIRKLSSRHLTLYTDLPTHPSVDELPQVFDLAVPQWAEYFEIGPQRCEDWRLVGCVMSRKETFQALELLPESVPDFPHGYNLGDSLWVYEQPSEYYRRHLVLHEGTHAFMEHFLGGTGPAWYREGTAELLGTHRWQGGRLQLNWFPPRKEDVPHWGRIKIIKDAYEAGRPLTLNQVFELPPDRFNVQSYGWSWAACVFFDSHPDYRERFRAMRDYARDNTIAFTQRFVSQFSGEERKVDEQWQLFVGNLDYGYDVARAAVVYLPGKPLEGAAATAVISADRGWQSTGLLLEKDQVYEISASGRYQVDDEPRPWWCEPNGVTIRYHDGRPLGMLVGALRNDQESTGATPLLHPSPIGLRRTIRPRADGTLYLRINESAANLSDNAGSLTVSIQRR